jgi:hypothetical protein
MFAIISEDKGGPDDAEDEYNRRDPEADSDEFLVNSGATIKYSDITITDSHGRNQTLV